MSQVTPNELFAFDDWFALLKQGENAVEDFSQSLVTWQGRWANGYRDSAKEARLLLGELDKLNVGQKEGGQIVADYAAKVADQSRKLDMARQAQSKLTEAQELNGQLVKDLTQKLTDLQKRYSALDPTSKNYAKDQRAILSEVRTVTRSIDAQSKTLTVGKAAIDAAEGSYQKLSKQTTDLRKQLREMPDAFDRETGAINKNNRAAVELQHQIQKNSAALQKADSLMGLHSRNVGNYGSALKGVAGQAVLAAGGIIGITSAIDAATKVLTVISDMERIDASLRAVSKDSADFSQTQEYLIGLSNDLGLQYETLAKSYKGLKAATNGTALEGKATQQIFSGLVRSGAALKLSNEEVQGAIMAVTQMMSKGKVSAEELRQQLAERLPGAVRLLADAMGVSESKLNKMMEQGQLLAVDVLPKLAAQLDKTYGAEAQSNVETMAGGWNLLTNEVHLFLAALDDNKAISNTATAFESMIARTLRGIRVAIQSNDWKTFFQAAVLRGPLDITGAGTRARQGLDNYADNDKTIAQYRTMTPEQRQSRRELTQESIDWSQNALTNRRSEMNSGNVAYYENIVARDTALMKKLNEEEKKLRRQQRKDNEQEEINAQRAAATRREQEAERLDKEKKKRDAERRKVDAAAERAKNTELGISKSGTGEQLANLDSERQDGLITEQDFIEKRLALTVRGLEERMAILRKYNQKESEEYKELLANKTAAETEYSRSQLQLDLKNSKTDTASKLAELDVKKQDGSISELEYFDQRLADQKRGVNQRLTILKESGKEETALYKDTYAELAENDADYYKDRLRVIKKAYKDEMSAVRDGLAEIDQALATEYEQALNDIANYYSKQAAIIEEKIAKGKLGKPEGEAALHSLQMQQLEAELAALTSFYNKDGQLSRALVDEKVAQLEEFRKAGVGTPAEIEAAANQIRELTKLRDKDAADDKMRLTKAVGDNEVETSNKTAENQKKNDKDLLERRRALIQMVGDLTQTGGDAVFSIVKGNLDRESAQLDKQKENELRLAGDNADARAKIEEQYSRKQAEIRRKQAVADREQALFKIALNAAVGVASVLSTGGGTAYADLGISAGILTAFVLATAALQAASVLAAPLPEFWKGTSNAPEGPAYIAERGPELRQRRDGSMTLYDKPTIDYLNRGDRIYTADQTSRFIADWQKQQVLNRTNDESAWFTEMPKRTAEGQFHQQVAIHVAAQAAQPGFSGDALERAFGKALDERPVEQTLLDENFTRKIRRSVSGYTERIEQRYS